MKVIPQFFDPFSPWKLHVRYLTRRYYPEQYRSLSFYGIFAISASFTEYMREKYVNIYRHMYCIYVYNTHIYIYSYTFVNTYAVYMYMNIFMYCVYGIFAISASFTEYMREKYVNIYIDTCINVYITHIYMYIYIYTRIYIYVNTYTVYMYMNIFMYGVYIY